MNSLRTVTLTMASLFCITLIALLVVQNWQMQTPLTVAGTTWPAVSLGGVILVASLLSGLGLFFRLWNVMQRMQTGIKQSELRKERAEVRAETSGDQIRALESKIQTLERALEQALSSAHSAKDV